MCVCVLWRPWGPSLRGAGTLRDGQRDGRPAPSLYDSRHVFQLFPLQSLRQREMCVCSQTVRAEFAFQRNPSSAGVCWEALRLSSNRHHPIRTEQKIFSLLIFLVCSLLPFFSVFCPHEVCVLVWPLLIWASVEKTSRCSLSQGKKKNMQCKSFQPVGQFSRSLPFLFSHVSEEPVLCQYHVYVHVYISYFAKQSSFSTQMSSK